MSVDAALTGPAVAKTAGLVTSVPGVTLAPSVRASVERAGKALADAGWQVEEVQPPEMEQIVTLWGTMMASEIEAAKELLSMVLSPPLVEMLLKFTVEEAYTEMPIATVHSERHRLGRVWGHAFNRHSVMVGPVWTGGILDADADIHPDTGLTTTIDTIRFSVIGNLLGLPSVAVPTGLEDGLPTGAQVYADLWREDLALDAAEAIEASLGLLGPIDPKY